jgi:hypothetical protein
MMEERERVTCFQEEATNLAINGVEKITGVIAETATRRFETVRAFRRHEIPHRGTP